MSPEFVPVDRGRLDLLANHLLRAAEIELFYTDSDFSWVGMPGSQANLESSYRGPDPSNFSWHPRLTVFTHSLIRLGVTVMAEQAMSIARLITDPGISIAGIFGTEVCARSAVEAGANAWWLSDPLIGAHERMARYWLDQLSSSYAAETLAGEMRWTNTVSELGFSPTSDQVKSSCASLGMIVGGSRKYPQIDGYQKPHSTDLVADLLKETIYADSKAMVYRLLSATAHGTFYGVMRAFRPTDETHKGEKIVERIVDHRIVESAVGVTLECFAVLMERIVEFMGWSIYRSWSFRNKVGNLLSSGPR